MRIFTLFFPLLAALPACGTVEVIDNLSGTVVDGLGAPAAGARVLVGDRVVTADSAGHFAMPAVPIPYDATVVTSARQSAYAFLGLTGAAPTLQIYDQVLSPGDLGRDATVTLDLPVAAGSTEKTSYVIDDPDDLAPLDISAANATATGQLPVTISWVNGGGPTVRVQAFRFEVDASGAPLHYTGYDSVMLALVPGGSTAWTASWKAPTFKESKLAVSVSLPSGYGIWQTTLSLAQDGLDYGYPLAWSAGAAPDVSFVAPDLDGATFSVQVCALDAVSSSCREQPGLTAGTQGTAMTVEPGPSLTSPAAGGSVGVGSEIQWAAGGDGQCFLLLYPTGSAVGPSYFIASADGATTLPDLGALGVKLPSGLPYTLDVFRNGSLATVDEMATKGPFFAAPKEPSTYAYALPIAVKTR
jgi:hypothetical protein